MLEIRPSCENCRRALPPDSDDAMICTYECTFCTRCVDDVLRNVCPNCGGGFSPRPVRPAKEWVDGVSRARQPASTNEVYKPVDTRRHAELLARVNGLAPALR